MQPFKLRPTDGADWFRANIKCQAACPVHTEAFAYVSALAEGDHEAAYAIARRPNPFPFICGRVCAHPCEQACRRGDIDEPISIRALKRAATDTHDMRLGHAPGLEQLPPREERVAVIGSGPAGMACAHDLARLGYPVTVFEAAAVPGGMLTLGIPEYRLPRETVQLEINEILELGVELKCNQPLGANFLLQDLKTQGFKAVFLAIGAHRSKDLRMEGMDLDGVLRGVEFLLNVNLGFRVWLGHRVVVIGGGNVAVDVARTAAREGTDPVAVHTTMDVARAARRLGSREIHVVCLESRDEMPAHGYEVEEAEREGIVFHPSIGPKRVLGVRHNIDELLRSGVEMLEWARRSEFVCRQRIADELLELYNDTWAPEEAPTLLTRAEFITRIAPNALSRDIDGSGFFYWADDDMFAGHWIELRFRKDYAISTVGLAG